MKIPLGGLAMVEEHALEPILEEGEQHRDLGYREPGFFNRKRGVTAPPDVSGGFRDGPRDMASTRPQTRGINEMKQFLRYPLGSIEANVGESWLRARGDGLLGLSEI